MGVKELAVALLRAEEERDAIVGAGNNQRRVRRGEAGEDVAAKAVAKNDGVVFAGGDGVNALLNLDTASGRDVVIALGQELRVNEVRTR